MKKRILVIVLLLFSILLVACGGDDEVKHLVEFNTMGGSTIESREVLEGDLVVRPTDPTLSDHSFKGWYKEDNHVTEWRFTIDKVEGPMTLYAKWELNEELPVEKVVVTFDFNFSGSQAPTTVEIDENTKVTNVPSLPSRNDFEFVGWSTSRTEFKEFDLNTLLTTNLTLYAFWNSTKEVFTVTIDLDYDGKIETMEVEDGQLLELDDPSRENYLFLGWLVNDVAFNLETPITENITLKANWLLDDSGLEGSAIATSEQLLDLFRTGGDGIYYLATDIDMSGVEYLGTSGTGDNIVEFSGTLNGNGKTIRNYNITTATNKSGAMFGRLKGATIQNLTIMRSTVNGPGEALGFVAAFADGGTTFENLTFINVGLTQASSSYAALLFADNQNNDSDEPVIIKNIVVFNDDNHVIEGGSYAAGLVGYVRHKQTLDISNVYINSKIVTTSTHGSSALVGRVAHADAVINIDGVYVEGEITSANNYVGGLVADANIGATIDIKNVVFNDVDIKGVGSSAGLLVGRINTSLTLTTSDIYYTSTTKVYSHNDREVSLEGETQQLITLSKEWFDSSNLNKEIFKFADETIKHNIDLGPVTPETLSIASDSFKAIFVKDVDTVLDLTQLKVSVSYSDGTGRLVDFVDLNINQEEFDATSTGSYSIYISYDGLEGVINIEVVAVREIEIIITENDTLFLVGETPNFDKMVVNAILDDNSHLNLKSEDLVITLSAETFGEQTVTVSFKDQYEETFKVTFIESKLIAENNKVTIIVDQNLTVESGTLVEGIINVKTVKEAINLIDKSNLEDEVIKEIKIKDGLYFEKLRVSKPNTHIIGESQENTIVDFNAANGLLNPLGGTYGTQGSATFTVATSATGFIAHNLTFSNSFDYHGSTITSKQAVALVNEADKALFYQVSFKGYQDTLYAKNGRQWYLDVYVEGIVDYIFGNGGPAFFEDSQIHTLLREGTSANAIITANQGLGRTTDIVLKYGYVFYNNRLTAAEGVADGTVDLGRPWRQDSAVTFIDNIFDTFISEAGWVDWDSTITAGNANYYEFNNKIGENTYISTAGKQLTEEEAKLHRNKNVIFGKVNGGLGFDDEWDYMASLALIAPNYFEEGFVKVTFEDRDNIISVRTIQKGTTIEQIEDPVFGDIEFLGWLKDGVIFDFNTPITSDTVLVASFEEGEVSFNYEFHDDLNTDDFFSATTSRITDMPIYTLNGTELTRPIKMDSNGRLTFTTPVANLILELVVRTRKDETNGRISIDGEIINLLADDFTFIELTLEEAKEYIIQRDNRELGIYYARVYSKTDETSNNTVSYMDGFRLLSEVEVLENETIGEVFEPTKVGFIFTEWLLNGQSFDTTQIITENLVLVASWDEIEDGIAESTAIRTVEDFLEFLTKSSGNYHLANDIDFGGLEMTTDEKKTFTGVLEGNNFTLKNFTRTTERGGLFRSLKGATFRNITFDNVTMIGTNRAGMIAGEAPKDDKTTTIENIIIINSSVTGAANNGVGAVIGMGQANLNISNVIIINSEVTNTAQAAGAIIGQIDGDNDANYTININDIYVKDVNISATNRVGGIYGESKNNANINVTNVVLIDVDINTTGNNAAVISGYHNLTNLGVVKNVFFKGTVSGSSKVGHVVAEKTLESFENIYLVEATFNGTINGVLVAEEDILTDLPVKNWWFTNLEQISTSDLWIFDKTLSIYKLK